MRSTKLRSAARAVFIEGLEERRLLSAGALDTSFGTGGIISQNFTADGEAVQSDGKIVVIGRSGIKISVTRFLATGKLDTSFGTNGTGSETFHFGDATDSTYATSVAIQSDGKIVISGDFENEPTTHSSVFVLRLLSNGSLDASFNGHGSLVLPISTSLEPEADAMAIQPDGKIVLAGTVGTGSSISTQVDVLISRVNADGTVDTSFGTHGNTTIAFDSDIEDLDAIAIDSNGSASTNSDFGKIVVAGYSLSGKNYDDSRFIVARLNTNGKVDSSFAGDGKTELNFPGHDWSYATGVVVQAGGKIVVGGYVGGSETTTDHNFAMARYLSNGTLDKTFGTSNTGLVDTDLGDTNDVANSLISGFSQKLILGGSSNGKFAMAAYTPDGILDPNFGGTGIVKTSVGTSSGITELAVAPNRTIMALGGSIYSGPMQLARYFDVGPKVSLFSTSASAMEHGQVPATVEVFRDAALPFATRVYFSITGTAKLNVDYTGITLKQQVNSLAFVGATTVSGLQPAIGTSPISILEIGYVDIPAGQQTATITIKPIDHGPEVNKTLKLQLYGNSLYDINTDIQTAAVTIVGDGNQPPPVTFQTDKPTADAYVQDGSTDDNKNFGTAKTLQVKASTTAGYNRESYLKFNIASSPTISSATLVLDGELSASDQSNLLMQIFGVSNTSWSETGITWNNKPAAGSTVIGSATILNTTENDYTIDITNYVRSQFLAGNKTISLMLKNASPSDPEDVFSSREGAVAPQLIIVN